MAELTKEEQVQAIYDLKVGYTLGHADIAMLKAMARQLLAGLEQEPVAYMYKDRLHTDARFSLHTRFGNWSQEDINEYKITEIPLYAAPQLTQPAVVGDDKFRADFERWMVEDEKCIVGSSDPYPAGIESRNWRAWNACRAAMLQGAEPVRGWIPCRERMPEGVQTVITSNGFDIGQGWWDGEGWNSFDCQDVVPGKVTHWMPLPAAPQQEVK